MKKLYIILILGISLVCCKEPKGNQDSIDNNSNQNIEQTSTLVPKNETAKKDVLCKVNGKDWMYTKASGIVSTHAKTKKETALITFKKKLEKGSESIQLHYETDSFKLIAVSLILKFPKKDGGLFTCYYDLHPDTRKRNPQSELSGSIDLSDASSASGNAEIKNLNIKYEKEKLQNIEDAIVSVTDLKFSEIGYSNISKLVKAFKK